MNNVHFYYVTAALEPQVAARPRTDFELLVEMPASTELSGRESDSTDDVARQHTEEIERRAKVTSVVLGCLAAIRPHARQSRVGNIETRDIGSRPQRDPDAEFQQSRVWILIEKNS